MSNTSDTTQSTSVSSKEASYYTIDEAVKKLKVTKRTVYNWARDGKLASITLSGTNTKRFDVDGFLNKSTTTDSESVEILVEEKQIATINTFIVEDEQTGQLIFKSDLTNSKELRIFGTCEEPLFVAKDVAEMLGYKDTARAIRDNVIEDDKLTCKQSEMKGWSGDTPFHFTPQDENSVSKGGKTPPLLTLHPDTILITESGLYSLILRSKLKRAKEFQRWVTKDVLPSIRKKGEFVMEDYKKKIEAQKKTIEEKETRVKYLENKYLHHQLRVQYPATYVIYMITTTENKKNLTYILGKSTNLTNRLSTYNKTCEHEVIYYRECVSETVMTLAETNLFLRLAKYREKLSCERFILPTDKDESFFISEINTTLDFYKVVEADDRVMLRTDSFGQDKKKQKIQHNKRHSEIYKKYRKEYYLKNKERINKRNNSYRTKNLLRVKGIERQSRMRNNLKEKTRKKIYRLINKEKIRKYLLENKEKLRDQAHQNYLKNRVKKIAASKTYDETHRNEKSEYLKKYRKDNKEVLKRKKSVKVMCICGVECTKSSLCKHEASKRHIDFLKSQNTDEKVIEKLESKNEKIKILEFNKDKQAAKDKRSEKVICECGDEVARGSLTRHKNTQKHLDKVSV